MTCEHTQQPRGSTIRHIRLPWPHKRLQIGRVPGSWRPLFYFYDHRITDELHGQSHDCRLGMVTSRKKLNRLMAQAGFPTLDTSEPPD